MTADDTSFQKNWDGELAVAAMHKNEAARVPAEGRLP